MKNEQKGFLFKWAKLCKKDRNIYLHCAMTIWDYNSVSELCGMGKIDRWM